MVNKKQIIFGIIGAFLFVIHVIHQQTSLYFYLNLAYDKSE